MSIFGAPRESVEATHAQRGRTEFNTLQVRDVLAALQPLDPVLPVRLLVTSYDERGMWRDYVAVDKITFRQLDVVMEAREE